MTSRPAKEAMFEQLAADGVQYMFGNPGTVEQGFLATGSERDDVEYVLALHEGVAVGIADGYARASRRPAVVQLHSGVGLGNAIGLLYQAHRGGSPLVVLAGEAGIGYEAMDAQMATDLVGMAEPVTKYATRVLDSRSVLRVLRRAVQLAQTPPTGPVLVVLPADVMEELTDEPARPALVPDTRVRPASPAVTELTEMMLAGSRPLILVGDGVSASGAQAELTAVAERLRAPVWGVNDSDSNFDPTHYLWGGQLGHMFGTASAQVVADADRVLVVGTYLFPEVFPAVQSPFGVDAKIAHIDLDSAQIGKNFPVDVGLWADPKLALAAVADEIIELRPEGWPGPHQFPQGAQPRPVPAVGREPDQDSVLHTFAFELAQQAGDDLALFDEALTASPVLSRYLPQRLPGQFLQTRGGSLGVGIPGAIGMKLARPELTTIGFTGDGGSMYTIQALWTAARHSIGAKFVICNNHRYQLLDDNLEQYWRDLGAESRRHPDAFDLSRPEIDFVGLARSLGVAGVQVAKPDDVGEAVHELLYSDDPFLVDLCTA